MKSILWAPYKKFLQISKQIVIMKRMLFHIIHALAGRPQIVEPKNFFDYPASEKKKIIVAAAKEAAKKQEETIKQFETMFPTGLSR